MRLLEEGLIEMDKEDERTESQRLICRDEDPKRGALQQLETTFKEYGTSGLFPTIGILANMHFSEPFECCTADDGSQPASTIQL